MELIQFYLNSTNLPKFLIYIKEPTFTFLINVTFSIIDFLKDVSTSIAYAKISVEELDENFEVKELVYGNLSERTYLK